MASKGDIHLEEASGQEARPQPGQSVAATPLGRQVGWYRLYDMGALGVQIMHYKMDGTPGQCCTVDRERLQSNIEALEAPWPQGRADVEPMFWARHEEPFTWEGRAQ